MNVEKIAYWLYMKSVYATIISITMIIISLLSGYYLAAAIWTICSLIWAFNWYKN